jgi:hypothetical protein
VRTGLTAAAAPSNHLQQGLHFGFDMHQHVRVNNGFLLELINAPKSNRVPIRYGE